MQYFGVVILIVFGFNVILANKPLEQEKQIGLYLKSHEPPYDLFVVQKHVYKKKIPILQYIFEVTENFTVPNGYKIAFIRAIDQKKNGHGAYAFITKGGLDQSSVTLKLETQRGHSVDYMVEIYADRIEPGQHWM